MSVLQGLPGAQALADWFGRVPDFHDAELLDIEFSGKGCGRIGIHAWNMTSEVDARGYFVVDRHAMVTLLLEGISAIDLSDFDMMPGIILALEVAREGEKFRIEWDASYGVTGAVVARQVRVVLEPGKP